MSKAKDEKRRWKEFERELLAAIEKDKTLTEEKRQAWLDTLPEHVPPPEGNMVEVIFFEGKRRTKGKRPLNPF